MVNSETSVFGYLMLESFSSDRVSLYSRFLEADPGSTIVPFRVKLSRLESAINTVRTGMVRGMCIDPALYESVSELVDAVTADALAATVIDTVYVDPVKGVLVGDCAAAVAYRALVSDYLDSVENPMALMYGCTWETRVAIVAMRGKLAFATVAGEIDSYSETIDAGCRVEYMTDNLRPEPFDLVSNPNRGYKPADGQFVVDIDSNCDGNVSTADFEARRLAVSVRRFMNLPESLDATVANEYVKKALQV